MLLTLHLVVSLLLIVRVILKPNRDPAARIAWTVVILILPALGVIAYLLLGETNIGRRRIARMQQILAAMPAPATISEPRSEAMQPLIPERYEPHFRVGQSINGFAPVGGNQARLMADSNASIDSIVADIDAATDHVHLLFYIWLPDTNGMQGGRGAEARCGARRRLPGDGRRSGLAPHDQERALAGDAGRRRARRPGLAGRQSAAGACSAAGSTCATTARSSSSTTPSPTAAARTAPIRSSRSRQNIAPWVDAMVRFEGPIARQNQYLFAADWMAYVDERIDDLLRRPIPRAATPGHHRAGGRQRPDDSPFRYAGDVRDADVQRPPRAGHHHALLSCPTNSMQEALCASARRGVATTIIFPARNDSRLVAAASRSNYANLLDAGVRIFEYEDGLLHTKSLDPRRRGRR